MEPQEANSPQLACSHCDLNQFDDRHRGHPFCLANPLYALPDDLLIAVNQNAPGWLSTEEISFERDLAAFCKRHHAVGIFHDRPVLYFLKNRERAPTITPEQFAQLGWDRFMTLGQAQNGIDSCLDLMDPVLLRVQGYVGWLLTNPQFIAERDQLRNDWDRAVAALGAIPAYPVRVVDDPNVVQPPSGADDVTNTFVSDFNMFYERWTLQSLVTWDLPMPLGANLTGHRHQLPTAIPESVGRFTIDIPSTLRLPANFPLHSLLEVVQRQQTPAHLRPWLDAQDQMHEEGLRHGRFGHMFDLAFYRDTVLAGRYLERFQGSVAKLDEAFASFMGLGVDSVKKLRLKMANLRETVLK